MATVQDLLKYIDPNKSNYHKKCYDHLRSIDNTIYEVSDKYTADAIKHYLVDPDNIDKYYLTITTVKPELDTNLFCYKRVKTFTEPILQFLGIYNSLLDTDLDNIYIIITNKTNETNKTNKINYQTITLTKKLINVMFNDQSLKFLEYCNFPRIQKFNKNIQLTEFGENTILWGPIILQLLGILQISDPINILILDTNVVANTIGSNEDNTTKYLDTNINFYNINLKNHTLDTNVNKNNYDYKYFAKTWPNLLNVESLTDIIYDPDYYCYYDNTKIITIDLFIKLLQKSMNYDPLSYTYLLLFNNYNNKNEQVQVCINNLYFTNCGTEVIINTPDKIKNDKIIISDYYKKISGNNDINDIESKIIKCSDLPHEIYNKKPERNVNTNGIIRYHNNVMNYYISRYFDKEKLLDIGAGPLRHIQFYEKIGIKLLVALEPSAASINTGLQKYKDEDYKHIKLIMIQGFGEEPWSGKKIYEPILSNKPYKSVLFKFTIHYMLSDIDQLLKNLQSVTMVGTTIIISVLNGDILIPILNKYGKHEIRDEQGMPLYGVYDYETENKNKQNDQQTQNYRQVMVYFKGVYGVDNGSIEYIVSVNYLIKKFAEYKFDIMFQENFMQVQVPKLIEIRKNYNRAQKSISELQHLLIFKRV